MAVKNTKLTRRNFLKGTASAGAVAVAGCTGNGGSSENKEDSDTNEENPQTTTETKEEEKKSELHVELSPEILDDSADENTEETFLKDIGVSDVNSSEANKSSTSRHVLTDPNGLKEVSVFLEHGGDKKDDGKTLSLDGISRALNENIESREGVPERAEAEAPIFHRWFGPGSNYLIYTVKDDQGKPGETDGAAAEIVVPNFPYRFDITGDTFTATDYNSKRLFDNVDQKRTEEDWERIYWENAKAGLERYDEKIKPDYSPESESIEEDITAYVEDFIDDEVEDSLEELGMEEKAKQLFLGIGHYMNEQEKKKRPISGSGGAADLHFTAQRLVARNLFNWDRSDARFTWIDGNKENHEVGVAMFNTGTGEESDWHIRFHDVLGYTDGEGGGDNFEAPESVVEDGYVLWGEPEETRYRAGVTENRWDVDGLNYPKLQRAVNTDATAKDIDGDGEDEYIGEDGYNQDDISEMVIESIMSLTFTRDFIDEFDYRTSSIGHNGVLEESLMKEIAEKTMNDENFPGPEPFERLGRTLYAISEEQNYKEVEDGMEGPGVAGDGTIYEAFAGGGSLGDEELWSAPYEAVKEARQSFGYNPGQGVNAGTGWENQHPPEAFDDVESLIEAK